MDGADGSSRADPFEVALPAEGAQLPVSELGQRWDFGQEFFSVEEGNGTLLTWSGIYLLVEDRLVPEWVNFKFVNGPDMPTNIGRIEIRDGVPQCVKLALIAGPADREIRQTDLRSIEINSLVTDLMAAFSIHVDQADPKLTVFRSGLPGADGPGPTFAAARRFMERQRRGPGTRDITPAVLQRVAEVYRANIDRAPTEAVAKAFGVKSRMASTYVQKARERGYLPPTKQGKKQA